MDDPDTPTERRSAAVEALSNVFSTVGGFVIGGAPGAVMASAAAPVLTHVARVFLFEALDRTDRLIAPARTSAGGDAQLAALLDGDPRLRSLLMAAVDSAMRATWEEHIDALAGVLRDAVAGQRAPDEALAFIDALADLRPLSVRALDLLSVHEPVQAWAPGIADTAVAELLGEPIGPVAGALRRLEEVGAAEPQSYPDQGMSFGRNPQGYGITPFGRALLSYLRDHE